MAGRPAARSCGSRRPSPTPDGGFAPDSPGHAFKPVVADLTPALDLRKEVHSAFHGDARPATSGCASSGVEQIAICGIQTNRCCESTARVGCDLGYDVLFVPDAMHTFDKVGRGRCDVHRRAALRRDRRDRCTTTSPPWSRTKDLTVGRRGRFVMRRWHLAEWLAGIRHVFEPSNPGAQPVHESPVASTPRWRAGMLSFDTYRSDTRGRQDPASADGQDPQPAVPHRRRQLAHQARRQGDRVHWHLPAQGAPLDHRGQLRARAVLAVRRRPAERAGPASSGEDRRLAEVQGPAGPGAAADGRPAGRPQGALRGRGEGCRPASPRPR